ncbi:hypothetical protein V9T40_001711 [Parthenolecanium corni]|uniref:Uncharacterized protein n=1 Tax=Parthenolecanium corni TaxID=536013 RepID=A0AAN9TEV4_9HEMI
MFGPSVNIMSCPSVIVQCFGACKEYERKRYLSWKEIDYGTVSLMIAGIIGELPSQPVALCLDYNAGIDFQSNVTKTLHKFGIKSSLYVVSSEKSLQKVKDDIKKWLDSYKSANFLYFLRKHFMERMLNEELFPVTFLVASEQTNCLPGKASEQLPGIFRPINENGLIHRNIIHIFLWIKTDMTANFRTNLHETARVVVVTNPRSDFYQIYYTQATSKRYKQLSLINWWTPQTNSSRKPLLPPASKVYRSFSGRTLVIPVLHKPPWYFVRYYNETEIKVEGGRDDKLLSFVANKLNFKCQYIDPPDRNQGSSVINGSMQGALDLVANRKADLFIGDLAITFERSQVVEFSFLTLVDSELFLTHSPGLLNEALALIRPFHWQVWPAIFITLLLSGPVLFLFVSERDYKGRKKRNKKQIFMDCVWITFTIFLQQAIKFRSKNQKVRFILILLSLSLTYVIGDMYSANLTSLFARPSKERPINTLEELAEAMKNENYQLLIEENSASHSMLENGTGIYKTIWQLMTKQQIYSVESTEAGMKLVQERKKIAIIGGRETFYYDTHRFGAENFHLSQRISTRYSAIAFPIGCPYLDNFNTVLLRLFEAGIYSKLTEDEYLNLRQNRDGSPDNRMVSEGANNEVDGMQMHLKAMSMKTLQGAFYVLIIGYIFSGKYV